MKKELSCQIAFIVMCLLLFVNITFSLEIVDTYDTPGYARNIALLHDGESCILADSNNVITFTEDGLGLAFTTPGTAYDVSIMGFEPLVFVADGDSGIHAFYSDTGTKQIVYSQYEVPGKTIRIISHLNSWLFALSDSGLFVYKVIRERESQLPDLELRYFNVRWCNYAEDISIEGDYAYLLSNWGSYLVKLDISDLNSIVIESVFRVFGDTCGVEVINDTAYIATSLGFSIYHMQIEDGDFVTIIDSTKFVYKDPISETGFYGHGEDIKILDHYAYISLRGSWEGAFNGVYVYDISDKSAPVLVDSCRTPGQAHGLFIKDDYLFCADGDNGIVVFDNSVSIYNKGEKVVGVNKIKLQEPLQIVPTKSNCQIVYSLKNNADISLTIISPNGKTICSIISGVKQKGRHSYFWDFKDNYGNAVPSGIYYIHLRINGYSFTKSFIKL